jgi:hypothetical protein
VKILLAILGHSPHDYLLLIIVALTLACAFLVLSLFLHDDHSGHKD